jgi:signal transduction histidine kinase
VLWAGAPNSAFWSSKDVADAYAERRDSGIVLLFASIASAVTFLMARRNLRQARILAITHERARIAAEKSEAEANRNAHQLQELNEHVSRLNNELSARLKDLHTAQEEIIKRGKMAQLGGLVATVAHEIRNPLASIRNTLFVIRRKFKDADVDATAQFVRVESGILRCDNIISQLLDFSRSQQIECSLQDISHWLQTLLEEEASRADPAIAIKLVLPDTVVGVGFDPERLRRAVINIFNNACEAVKMRLDTQAGFVPSVCVSLAQTSRGIEICISDNGPGISKELLPRVGEPFFTSKSFGSGLGVAAATQVALLHGGGLDVSSTPGEGATFTIWLPTREVRVRAA